MADAVVIAIVGAESTGKTVLAQELAERLAQETGWRVTWVPEWLRTWCAREGRTPCLDEQSAIARVQHEHIEAAAGEHDVVVCDTTALTTAVYSRLIFGDRSLDAAAVALHHRVDVTLLTALDLPWVPDGHQREGAHVRAPVDAALRELLVEHGIDWTLVSGRGERRTESALDAVAPRLRSRPAPRPGLFRRLARRDAAEPAWTWVCDTCDVPECEHATMRRA